MDLPTAGAAPIGTRGRYGADGRSLTRPYDVGRIKVKILKLYRVFGTMSGKDLVVPAIEVAADSPDEAMKLARSVSWELPVTGVREAGEVIVP